MLNKVAQEPGEAGPVCTFEMVAGEQFSLPAPYGAVQMDRLAMSEEVEAEVREMLEEGGLDGPAISATQMD